MISGVVHYSMRLISCFWQTQEQSFKTCWMDYVMKSKMKFNGKKG